MDKNTKLVVQDTQISIAKIGNEDYLCLTDMVSNQESGSAIIENGLEIKILLNF